MKPLAQAEIDAWLAREPLWKFTNGQLSREWKFKDFVAAIAFVNQVAEMAEAVEHHPDIDIRYNQVRLGLVTHDAGGVTAKDADMAERFSRKFANGNL
jgi:4a-hydroxytetrahydrobiopterin dehydratase